MLRQRVASLMVRELPPETTSEIRQKLEEGENIEVSGYTVGGALIRDIESVNMNDMAGLCSGKIYWLENVSEPGQSMGVASRNAVEQLGRQDNEVEVHLFADPAIWLLHYRDLAPELLSLTNGLLV